MVSASAPRLLGSELWLCSWKYRGDSKLDLSRIRKCTGEKIACSGTLVSAMLGYLDFYSTTKFLVWHGSSLSDGTVQSPNVPKGHLFAALEGICTS